MANKPALFGASQSSSFGHLRPPPQTSVTTTHNRAPLHNPPHANNTLYSTQQRTRIVPSCGARSGALDKALDTWYNTGVGLKEYMNRQQLQHTGALNDND